MGTIGALFGYCCTSLRVLAAFFWYSRHSFGTLGIPWHSFGASLLVSHSWYSTLHYSAQHVLAQREYYQLHQPHVVDHMLGFYFLVAGGCPTNDIMSYRSLFFKMVIESEFSNGPVNAPRHAPRNAMAPGGRLECIQPTNHQGNHAWAACLNGSVFGKGLPGASILASPEANERS